MIKLRYPKSVDFQPKNIRTKKELIKQLAWIWPNIIHVSAHGDSERYPSGNRGKKTSFEVGRGSISSDEISKLPKNKVKLVFVSACLNSYKDMADSFLNRGAEKFLAPKTKIDWVYAALFSVMFYRRYVYDRTSFETAFRFARKHTKLGKDFPEYWYNTSISSYTAHELGFFRHFILSCYFLGFKWLARGSPRDR